ncbi:MAG: LTA synthase family protein [Candidatus Riflebacteria bacterium]|nr:LTA synthase family protein [Candidatus Riflebacteria bacterium]
MLASPDVLSMLSQTVSSAGLLGLALQSWFLAGCYFDPRYRSLDRTSRLTVAVWVLTNWLVVVSSFQLVDCLFGPWPWMLRVANLAGLCFFAVLGCFQFHNRRKLDYALLRSMAPDLFGGESLQVVRGRVGTGYLMFYGLSGVLLLAVGLGTSVMAGVPGVAFPVVNLALSATILVGLVVSPAHCYTAATYLARTAIDRVFWGRALPDASDPYPYWTVVPVSGRDRGQSPDRPHVFIVMIESFNANFVGARDLLGREFTPNFNRFAQQGLHVDRFYGNSVQTVRGTLAVLASLIPSTYSKVFDELTELRLKALPRLLKAHGYDTHYFQGSPDLLFENTGPFMRHMGFDAVHGMDREWVTTSDWEAYHWGWGIQDNVLYRRYFEWLDTQQARPETDARDPRYFCLLCPVSNHMMFDRVPVDQQYLYPGVPWEHPTWSKEAQVSLQFANSIHLADRYLGEFFEELGRRPYLANSVVIVTGDHSFPNGEHGTFFNEQGYYEENFRTPFALVWKDRVLPQTVSQTAYCQLDIAPTLLDLLQLRDDHHFLGRSMLPGDRAVQAVIPLVQPYDSTYLCSVLYPLKYVQQQSSARAEFLHDLSRDPHEDCSILDQYAGTRELDELRAGVQAINRNDRLLRENRICPPDP